MKTYLVGGAVRDKLLGKKPNDFDYVIVGASHQQMLKTQFLPVGKSHTVYLHPISKEQYTLANSLEEDLIRRDLTINGMAMDGEYLIDPFGGKNDLERKIFRHIREENFFSDPLRVYRVARLHAQFPNFSLHPETQTLLKNVAQSENFKNLFSERVFNELKKSLSSPRPSHFFHLVKNLGALHIHFPEIDDLPTHYLDQTMKLLNASIREKDDGILGFFALGIHLDREKASRLSKRLGVPFIWARGIKLVARFYQQLCDVRSLSKSHLVDILYSLDAFRQDKYIFYVIELLKLDDHHEEAFYLQSCWQLVRSVGISDVNNTIVGKHLGEEIKKKRIQLLNTQT